LTKYAQDRREFFRINFSTPLNFKSYSRCGADSTQATEGISQNISQSGILFQIEDNPPQLSSIVWMNLDIRTISICKEIEKRALVLNNGLLGRVVRVEEDTNNSRRYDVGVCFLTQEQKDSQEVAQILQEISKDK
jgi:hypothetical protein